MSFDISFMDEQWVDEEVSYRSLRITLGDFQEEMSADLIAWSESDYEAQWLRELTAIVDTRDKGALITSIHDPRHGYRVWTWPMWRRDGNIHFHNRILFMLDVKEGFDPVGVSDHIGSYQSHDEDGQQISEWVVPTDAIRSFLANQQ